MEKKEGVWADEEERYRIAFCGFVNAESAGLSYEGEVSGHPVGWFVINVPDTDCLPLYPSSYLSKLKMREKGNEAKEKQKILSTDQPLKPISVSICNIYHHNAAIGSHLYSLGYIEDVCSDSSEDNIVSWRLDLNSPSDGWKRGPNMNVSRWDPQTLVLDGKLYALDSLLTDSPPSDCGWMEVFDPDIATWESLPNPPSPPPSCHQIRHNDFTCAVLESKKEILLAKHFVNDDDNLYFATFYAFNVVTRCWTTLMPLKRKLHGCFPRSDDRRAVAVGTTLYWGAFSQDSHEGHLFYVQAYDLDKDVWLHGRLNTRPLFGKHEGPRFFDRSPRLLHLRDHIFCLLLHAYSSSPTDHLYCLIVNIEPISSPILSDDDDDEEEEDDDHLHKLKLSISIISVQKYPLNEVSSLWDNVLLP